MVSIPVCGADHEYPVYLHYAGDLRQDDSDLPCDLTWPDPAFHYGKQRMAQRRAELLEISAGTGVSGISHYGMRGHLCGADTDHRRRRRHLRRDLAGDGLHGTFVLLPVQNRQHGKRSVRRTLTEV